MSSSEAVELALVKEAGVGSDMAESVGLVCFFSNDELSEFASPSNRAEHLVDAPSRQPEILRFLSLCCGLFHFEMGLTMGPSSHESVDLMRRLRALCSTFFS